MIVATSQEPDNAKAPEHTSCRERQDTAPQSRYLIRDSTSVSRKTGQSRHCAFLLVKVMCTGLAWPGLATRQIFIVPNILRFDSAKASILEVCVFICEQVP